MRGIRDVFSCQWTARKNVANLARVRDVLNSTAPRHGSKIEDFGNAGDLTSWQPRRGVTDHDVQSAPITVECIVDALLKNGGGADVGEQMRGFARQAAKVRRSGAACNTITLIG